MSFSIKYGKNHFYADKQDKRKQRIKITDYYKEFCKKMMQQKAVAKQNPDTYEPWQKALMCAGTDKCNWTDKKYLNLLVKYIHIMP